QPRAIGQCADGALPRPAFTFRSIEAGREPALSLPKGRSALQWFGIFYSLINRKPHPSPHRPAFALACDLFRFHVNGFTNRLRPRRPCLSLANHTRRECDGTA